MSSECVCHRCKLVGVVIRDGSVVKFKQQIGEMLESKQLYNIQLSSCFAAESIYAFECYIFIKLEC